MVTCPSKIFDLSILFFSYLLGSIPFGYLITKFSTKKNILEIGWKKTSGSNVFKYVGKWQGILTGILDLGKGFLAVKMAQNFGFSPFFQILSGFTAVIGHNWSIFLKFAGGRGIGTFLGAFLALNPKILTLSIIPPLILTLIWNTSVGTILFFFWSVILAIYFNQFLIALFIFLVSFPVFIKRLSPIKEIFPLKNNLNLIRNRLIFDNDKSQFDLRIKKIIKKLKKI